MHRLVQLTTRVWLKIHGQTEHWREQFVDKLCQEFPTGEYEDWGKYQSLFPHVKSALLQRPESQESLKEWATLLYRGAWYARESRRIADMKEMASKSREQRVRLFGIIDDETLNSTEMLPTAYWVEARWKEAEMLSVLVMETRKMKLGEDHPDTSTSKLNLASTYRNQGLLEEAEKLELQVMESLDIQTLARPTPTL